MIGNALKNEGVQVVNENLELYFLIKNTIEKIELSFLARASYCTLFSQQGHEGQNKPLVSKSDKTRIFTSQIVNRGILRYQKSASYATKSQVLLAAHHLL